MKSGIYYIKNKINNNIYIGSSKNILHRFSQHKYSLCNNRHENPHLQSAFNKYGKKNFIFMILERCPPKSLEQKEQYWMDILKVTDRDIGYNIRPDAKNIEFSEEHKKNISISLKKYYSTHPSHNIGKHHSEETKKKISEGNKGKKLTEETKKKISINSSSRNAEIKLKISLSNTGKKHSEETKKKIRECSKKMWKRLLNEEPAKHICEVCKKEYLSNALRTRYCSNACSSVMYRRNKKNRINFYPTNMICSVCNKTYYSKLHRGQYCSNKCCQVAYKRRIKNDTKN